MSDAAYIHGTDPDEQARLARLNDLTNEPFVRFLDLGPADVVLDVGCGLGILTRLLARRLPTAQVHGVDASAEQLARADLDLPNVHFQRADAASLPFADGTFDVVFCRYLLEHVSDPLGVLREMHRVLKPGGQALAQENNDQVMAFDPDCPNFDALWRKFVGLQARLGGDGLIGKKLYRLFCAAGFAEIRLSIQPEVHHAGQPSFRVWIENLIGNVRPCAGQLIETGLATVDEVHAGLADLSGLLTNESASAYFYWNRAVGVK
jgi:SAM-dependent methyltransferase